jgi:hypothetical protein
MREVPFPSCWCWSWRPNYHSILWSQKHVTIIENNYLRFILWFGPWRFFSSEACKYIIILCGSWEGKKWGCEGWIVW